MTNSFSCDSGGSIVSIHDTLFEFRVGNTLIRANKPGTHLYPLSSKGKSSNKTAAICNTTGRNYWYLYRINYLRDKCHAAGVSHMPSGFGSLCNHGICSGTFKPSCQSYAGYYRNNLYTEIFKASDVCTRVSSSKSYYTHLFTDDQFQVFHCIWRHKHDINPEGLIGLLSGFIQLLF